LPSDRSRCIQRTHGRRVATESRLLKLADVYLDYALAHPKLFELMFLAPRPGARRFPRDFTAGRSPTGNLFMAALVAGMASGYLRDDDAWEITFEMGALLQGLIMLYLGGRMMDNRAQFRARYRRSLRRYLRGIRS
jgi:Tetracyclin repressor-like, C-terminal domain